MLKRILLAVVVLSFSATSGFAQDVFVSFGDALSGEAVANSADGTEGTSGTAYLYVRNGFEFDGFQVDLVSTDTSVATITSATTNNANAGASGTRFNNADVDTNSNGVLDGAEVGDINSIPGVVAGDVATLQATSINQNGIIAGLFAQFDTGYDATTDLFQLGSFQYDVVGGGTTQFELRTTGDPVFAGPTGFLTIPEGVSLNPVFASASLNVATTAVPEPSTLGLLAFGLVGFVARRRR